MNSGRHATPPSAVAQALSLLGALLAGCFTGASTELSATDLSGQASSLTAGQSMAASAQEPNTSPATQSAATPAKPTATFLGRTLALDPLAPDLQRLAWAGVAVGGRFRGTTLSATFADGSTSQASGARALVDVVVDGNVTGTLMLSGPARRYPIATDLADGEHTVWLYKRTEPDYGQVNFLGFNPEAGSTLLSPPAAASRHLLVMGASSEVGFGVTGNDQNCATHPILYQNQQLAWPQRAADLLGADLENLSLSARGLVATASTLPDANHTSSALFFQTDPILDGHLWDPQRRPIDAVMFNLGANDWHFFSEGPPPKALFERTFVSLIGRIRLAYPNARIYLTLIATATGDERATFAAYYQDIVATMRAQGDEMVFYFPFTPAAGLACWGHPDAALHLQMAQDIAVRIAQDMGWPAPPGPN